MYRAISSASNLVANVSASSTSLASAGSLVKGLAWKFKKKWKKPAIKKSKIHSNTFGKLSEVDDVGHLLPKVYSLSHSQELTEQSYFLRCLSAHSNLLTMQESLTVCTLLKTDHDLFKSISDMTECGTRLLTIQFYFWQKTKRRARRSSLSLPVRLNSIAWKPDASLT